MTWTKYILLILITLSCTEPIDFSLEANELIVVDGKISTRTGDSYVKIYRSSSENRREDLSNYKVTIHTESGEKIVFTKANLPGNYLPQSSFQGEIGERYRLQAISPEGLEIVSTYDLINEPTPFELEILDTSEEQLNNAGLLATNSVKAVIAKLNTEDRNSYRSKLSFEYRYRPQFIQDSISKNNVDEFALFECVTPNECQNKSGILAAKQQDISWYFRSPDCAGVQGCPSNCCLRAPDWITVFVVTQEAMSPQTYKFWKDIEKLLTNDGLIFDTFPFPISGNVSCANCDIPVVGNVSAVSVNSKKSIVWL